MLTTEKPHLVNDLCSAEKELCFEHDGEPLYRTRVESERAEAKFSVELVGIERGLAVQEREAAAKQTGEEAWLRLPSLGLGQSLEFVYCFTGDRVICTLRACVYAEAEADALASARTMWRNMEIWLDAQDGYHFVPVVKARLGDSFEDRSCRTVVPLAGLRVESGEARGIGYMTADNSVDSTAVVLRSPTTMPIPEHLEKMVRMLTVYHRQQVEVVFSVEPYSLDGCGRRLVEIALTTVRGSGAVHYDSGIEVRDLALLDIITAKLERWCQSSSGFHLTCEVRSDSPVPEAFLDALGNESSHSHSDKPVVSNKDSDLLDLRNIVHRRDPLPPLLPACKILAESGMPFCYSNIPHGLADNGILLGRAGHGRFSRNVHLSDVDRERHCYLLGATGTGKSTLLYNMLMQDIKAGSGVCLIDPHGDLYHQVLDALPLHRAKDLVAIDMCDFERSVGINFLECEGPYRQQQMGFITNETMEIFKSLYSNIPEAFGPMYEQYMRNALLLVMDDKHGGGTLMDISRVFEDTAYRNRLLARCRNPFTKSFWHKQALQASGEISLANVAPYITCKLNQFTGNALLRPVICQAKSTVDFRQCMDEKRIVLVNLSKGILGDLDSRLLGMLIVGKIFGAATQRVIRSGCDRVPFHLYIDETHNFATDTLVQMLAESRKFGLRMVLANQNLAQLNNNSQANVMQSVLGNAGTLLSFRLGAPDAEKLETYFKPRLKASDLVDLPNYHVAARLLANNSPVRPFVFKTMNTNPGVLDAAGQTEKEKIVQQMRKRYTRSVREVKEALIERRKQIFADVS